LKKQRGEYCFFEKKIENKKGGSIAFLKKKILKNQRGEYCFFEKTKGGVLPCFEKILRVEMAALVVDCITVNAACLYLSIVAASVPCCCRFYL
jgi:hypothetical protein